MNQFIEASAEAFTAMLSDLRGDCVRFRDQKLPPGCLPERTEIGFEINPSNEKIRLLVTVGIRYDGTNASIRQWLADGIIEFDDVNGLVIWLRKELGPAMTNNNLLEVARTRGAASSSPQEPLATPITDTQQVTARIQQESEGVFVEEETLFTALSERVKGQDDALLMLSSAVSRHVARREPRRPLTVFATGPTGVGKTKTGITLTGVLNKLSESGDHYEFLRLDMCEYQEAYRISQLIGSPQGYVGYGDGAQLTDALARNIRTVVLFDEIEKAHPDILKVLMNAMDAGRLSTASRGSGAIYEVDCRKAIFFFSSNLESESIQRSLEQRHGYGQPELVDEVCRSHLKTAGISPELIGRIGHFLAFKPLDAPGKVEIVALEIREAAAEYGLDVRKVAPEVVVDIIRATKSSGFGARTYDYQIHRVLGRVFTKAARDRVSVPLRILGPAPYRYKTVLTDAPEETDTGV